ncbi:YezD family protein [Calidifontibacillus erzurumensis]|uniref:YezD family protein n=1 Tax=Calidifontibacillus erzurumensis TaxID=2741433 RepID=UPI0022A880CF|nr:DUF2292 domain-containing protein [Calidifontibacillus erzurumensis]
MISLSLNGNLEQKIYENIKTMLESIKYGKIQITVHDSQITQIEKVEKYHFPLRKKQAYHR